MIRKKIVGLTVLIGFFMVGVLGVLSAPRSPSVSEPRQAIQRILVEGVCPPFFLYDESGKVIDPVRGINIDRPYSPKQTCGTCHDYNKTTEGFHFQQGRGEKPPALIAERCLWVTSPGNYGGNWCSPAPLYRHLATKKNESPRIIDMTSFDFVVSCGSCHPGGGPLEYDRDGYRYDSVMTDLSSNMISSGENNLDGDYYKAQWDKSGVLEADCFLCHMPEYNFSVRNQQISKLNFRWAATAGSELAVVTGAVKEGKPVKVSYDKSRFDEDGKLSPHIVREPRTEACLNCHAKPGWKKRGANFRARSDVHLAAGLKCIDCHPAGERAEDSRIKGKDVHQIGKGDDPGGHVRDDLDNTCRDCAYCHEKGYLNAPIAKHNWLPPLHMEKIACQTCHIPQRTVKAALFQASDVFNPGTKIPEKGKYLWTFYGPDMKYWNHYGELEMMGYDDKPTDPYRPVLARYKEKIYPVNRVHSAWPGIEIQGKTRLAQPLMSDVYKMWVIFKADTTTYPELSLITDDNGDGVIEINRPQEIDALITSLTMHLRKTGYPLEGKRVVWVSNDRVYSSGREYREIPMELWEASPYGNVHKYSHDVYPAKAALGINGCGDCHSRTSQFFLASVVKRPFDEKGRPVVVPQYTLLGLSAWSVGLGMFRESDVKPILYVLFVILLSLFVIWTIERALEILGPPAIELHHRVFSWVIGIAVFLLFFYLIWHRELLEFMLPGRFWLDSHHFAVGALVMIIGTITLLVRLKQLHPGKRLRSRLISCYRCLFIAVALLLSVFSGFLMLLHFEALGAITRISYTIFDLSLVLILLGALLILFREISKPKGRVVKS